MLDISLSLVKWPLWAKKIAGESKENEGEQPKKRIIRNPQPKLDPDRICGARGIGTLSDIFTDFKPKGGDHVFEDLEVVMQKMEHWMLMEQELHMHILNYILIHAIVY